MKQYTVTVIKLNWEEEILTINADNEQDAFSKAKKIMGDWQYACIPVSELRR